MGRHFLKVRGPRSYWAPSNQKVRGPGPPGPPGSDAYVSHAIAYCTNSSRGLSGAVEFLVYIIYVLTECCCNIRWCSVLSNWKYRRHNHSFHNNYIVSEFNNNNWSNCGKTYRQLLLHLKMLSTSRRNIPVCVAGCFYPAHRQRVTAGQLDLNNVRGRDLHAHLDTHWQLQLQ